MRIGFIGLGLMGAPMVRHLLSLGHQLTVWNREPERYAETAGAKVVDSPAAVRAATELVILCVLDANAVAEVCFGQQGLIQAEGGAHTLMDTSTINPDRTRDLADRLRTATGMAWIDAPLSGGPPLAAEGGLTIMVGGETMEVAKVRPILDQLGAVVTHMGALGAGQTAKIINQAIVGASYVLMAEVLALAKASGLDAALLPAALAGGLADSQALRRVYVQQQQEAYDPPRGYARQLDKDLINVAGFICERRLELPLIDAAVRRYHEWAEARPMADSASIAQDYER